MKKFGRELLSVYFSELCASSMSMEEKYEFLAELFAVVASHGIAQSKILTNNKAGAGVLAKSHFNRMVSDKLHAHLDKLK